MCLYSNVVLDKQMHANIFTIVGVNKINKINNSLLRRSITYFLCNAISTLSQQYLAKFNTLSVFHAIVFDSEMHVIWSWKLDVLSQCPNERMDRVHTVHSVFVFVSNVIGLENTGKPAATKWNKIVFLICDVCIYRRLKFMQEFILSNHSKRIGMHCDEIVFILVGQLHTNRLQAF